ncbi:MAG: phospholipase D-like domain-containing protein [Salinivirgaceae bacterium]|jgi:phosphatidylserine/phosphatidylglycerophosphate/cardiolipin synthase-like enzyme|nr:phospholipase D-like domain-containing protein [Salinivirgaceae bacterium]
MKNILFTIILALIYHTAFSQISISEARGKEEGTTVTISGIVLNGNEMGLIRYVQDETAGIAVYSSLLSDVKRGDKITVTGALKDYNGLLELDPVSENTVNSSGNTLPQPIVLSPSQLAEEYESEMIEIRDVIFANGGSTFTGNTSFSFSTNGETASIYVKAGSPLEGKIIPSGKVKLFGICSQYSFSDPSSGYQMLLRDMDDIQNNSTIFFTSAISLSNLSKNGFDLNWSTNTEGTTQLLYGNTNQLEKDTLIVDGNLTQHKISISDALPSELFYVKAMSSDGIDTTYSPIQVFVTQSESSGNIKVYFNTQIEDAAATGEAAIMLDQAIDDTLIQYINRAEISIDLAIYNINNQGLSNMSEALNNAYARGVKIRIVHDGSTACLGLQELNSAIPALASPTDETYGIMHNKFLVIDADSDNENMPKVWTGSTNLTVGNINEDANNVVIIQDKSLAIAYKLEFEEMWGSNTQVANASKAKFGFDKSDNTPHEFIIGGNNTELYFSPTDQTNKYIIDAINSADTDLSIETMLITRSDIGYAIVDANQNGVATNVITNAEIDNSEFVNELLQDELKVHFTYNNVSSGVLHNKLMIVDQSNLESDPLVLTGSHNWSNAANNINDENTLIIHNANIANLYYQQFIFRFIENEGSFTEINNPPIANNDTVLVAINGSIIVNVLENDSYISDVSIEIFEHANNGLSEIPFTNPTAIKYQPNQDFIGTDTIKYKLSYKADPDLSNIGYVIINVSDGSTIFKKAQGYYSVYPNPNKGNFSVIFSNNTQSPYQLKIIDLRGKTIYTSFIKEGKKNHHISLLQSLDKGCYLVQLNNGKNVFSQKIIIE